MMLRRLAVFCAIAAWAFAADAAYFGTWKANMAKSQLSGTSVTYQKLASDQWQATADGVSYKFKMDGNEYPDNMGEMTAWKNIDANTWQVIWKVNGKLASTDTLTLGVDGLLTISSKGTKANGEPLDETAVLQRVSGGPGLAGKWKIKSVQSGAPEVMQLIATGGDGLTYKNNFGVECPGKLDGKDYPCTGPLTPSGWTSAMAKSGANSITITIKKDGKALYRYTDSVSADGKTLTSTGGALATKEPTKMVYDRQ